MNLFETWFLRRVLAREVRQGFDHPKRITNLYRMIDRAAAREFSEDNDPTRHEYLRAWFEAALVEPSA